MAKKKTNAQVKQVEEKIKPTETKTTLTYTGEVTMSINNGKKVISSKTYHNAGTQQLFDFLYRCLAGNFVDAGKTRPNKIMLFTNEEEEKKFDPSNPALTSFIASNTTTVKDNNDGVVLHFLVPFTSFKTNINKITEIALYNQDKTDYLTPSAYYLLLNNKGEWDPLIIENNKNFNLVIEWKLKIANIAE